MPTKTPDRDTEALRRLRALRVPNPPRPRRSRHRFAGVVTVLVLVAAALVARHIVGPGSNEGTAIDPSAFSPGACRSFPPTSGDRHLTVFLDAGHGGIDPGGVGTTESGQSVNEAAVNLPIELDTMARLRRDGFRVVVSRTGQTSVARLGPADVSGGLLTLNGVHDDVAARDVCANDAHADVLVGIYSDAGNSPSDAGAITGYDSVRSFAAANLRLANLLQQDVLAAMNAHGWDIPNDGVVSDSALGSSDSSAASSYGHLMLLGPAEAGYFETPSQMPGALIEPLFLTDPFEGSLAASTKGQEAIASGLARAIEQYFSAT